MAKIFPKIETVSLESEFGDEKGFTEWLANKETNGLQLLGEAVGIELAFEGLEVSTGQFRIDIVANSTDDNSKVIIENQIEATNHKHLGQCLTYASAFDDCKTIIWIAKKFNDEHKRAIDWLVDKTNKLNKCLRKILPKFNVGVFQESESSDDSPVNPE